MRGDGKCVCIVVVYILSVILLPWYMVRTKPMQHVLRYSEPFSYRSNVGRSFGYLIPATTVLKNPLMIDSAIIRRQWDSAAAGGRRGRNVER